MERNYSFFYLRIKEYNNNLILKSTVSLSEDKMWQLDKIESYNKGIEIFQLSWIDLIKHQENRVYGQAYDVTIWFDKSLGFLVFTTSFSTLSLVRLFLKEEFNINSEIRNFTTEELLYLIEKKDISIESIYIRDGEDIIEASLNYLKSSKNNDNLFAIHFMKNIHDKYVNLSLFRYGLVKLSYGIDESDFVGLCNELEIFKQ